jgi:dTMP kinase
MYLAIEGVDTCGKSTQIELLKNAFPDAVFTKEPGGTELGVKFREILLGEYDIDKRAEFLLFLADRAQHSAEVLAPNLAQNRVVISDRSMISGLAYSRGLFDEKFLLDATLFAMNGKKPDIVILLKLKEEELTKRLGDKAHDRIEKQGIEYLLSVQSSIEYCSNLLGIRIIVVDASESRESIFAQISNIIKG